MIVKRAWNPSIKTMSYMSGRYDGANNLPKVLSTTDPARNKNITDISDNEKELMRSMLFWRHAFLQTLPDIHLSL